MSKLIIVNALALNIRVDAIDDDQFQSGNDENIMPARSPSVIRLFVDYRIREYLALYARPSQVTIADTVLVVCYAMRRRTLFNPFLRNNLPPAPFAAAQV